LQDLLQGGGESGADGFGPVARNDRCVPVY